MTLQRRTPLKRTPMKRGKPPRAKRNGKRYPAKMVEEVRRRSGGRCELRHPGCTHLGTSHHHRHMQGQGGPDTAGNILWLCSWCHSTIIHGNTGWAYRHGLLVKSWDDQPIEPVAGCGVLCEVDHTLEVAYHESRLGG